MSAPSILHFPAREPAPDPTVREVVGLYWSLEARVEERRSQAPWRTRKRLLDEFVAVHGDLRVSECRKHHLKAWIAGNPKNKSDWTRRRVCGTIQRAFNWAVDDEYIAFNPFRGVRFKRGKRRRPLTDDEFAKIIGIADYNFGFIMRVMQLTGARPEELRDATWPELTMDVASLRGTITRAEHKTCDQEDALPRVIALPPEAVKRIVEHYRALPYLPGMAPDNVFLNSHGRAWTRSAFNKRFRQLRTRLGLPKDAFPYGLRHKFGTDAIVGGMGIKDVADLLGHKSTQTTLHYLHTAGMRERLIDLAAKAIGPGFPAGPPAAPAMPRAEPAAPAPPPAAGAAPVGPAAAPAARDLWSFLDEPEA